MQDIQGTHATQQQNKQTSHTHTKKQKTNNLIFKMGKKPM